MSNPASETFGQARQGSVAAIIQLLNERLADAGIRTRAVVAEGMLQVLCEAPSTDQLEKTAVVDRVRQILENISPQGIRRVNINSRIVKEEQLLWLEEINRDPENALLWSEVITLKRPFFIKRWIRDRNLKPAGPILRDISEPAPQQSSLSSKLVGAAGLGILVLGTGWLFREDLSQIRKTTGTLPEVAPQNLTAQPPTDLPPLPQSADEGPLENTLENPGERTADTTPPTNASSAEALTTQAASAEETADTAAVPTNSPGNSTADTTATQNPNSQPSPDQANSGQAADAFAEAVRIANQAVADGQTASSAAEWLDLATRWQRASDLMSQVPEGNEQYAIAQNRIANYATNSQTAIQKAAAMQ
ncbi:MAG: hypothetical protein AAFQ40_11600 [Cyanobacteria bacterium J06623_5]